MTEKRRVIVTQNDSAGRSSVLEDVQMDLFGVGVFNFWQTFPDRSPDDLSGRGPDFKFFPKPGGTQFRLFTIPPADPSATPDQIKAMADGFFQHVGWASARRDTKRHPFMHVTPTAPAKSRCFSMRATPSLSSPLMRWCNEAPITRG